MPSAFSSILDAQFDVRLPAPQLGLVRALKAQHPGAQHVSVLTYAGDDFPLHAYLAAHGVPVSFAAEDTHAVLEYDAGTRALADAPVAAAAAFTWRGTRFDAFLAGWRDGYDRTLQHLVFGGPDDAAGRALVKAVYDWEHDAKDEIWVFEDGDWVKSKELHAAVCRACWEDVVLPDAFQEGLRRDTQTFFESREAYEALGVAWKRGILLLGPPGNGKTESIKALLKETKGVSPLYVKSFTTCRGPEQGIRSIFSHARSHSPCILILEDLDSMLAPGTRSFFLNELDGLANNRGILTIATTNHPERIDDAILNRPSRFDVKYTFALPAPDMRRAFARKWLAKVNAVSAHTGVAFADVGAAAAAVAARTEGWSYAFLKELFVSFLLRMAHDRARQETLHPPSGEEVHELLMAQVDQLALQIVRAKDFEEKEKEKEDGEGSSPE
ncbi:ATP-binding protein [Phanerochaete sordida]|uniref:ATP-binding protein n=1 Tax=Phanerochaete sordida TaxID=48140 RepID=A0A9P3LJB2_9APHY|nr:ATP-binding protein [Phanerochaete sordida]